MTDNQSGQTVPVERPDFRAMPADQITVDMILPQWQREPGKTGRLTAAEKQAKAANAAAREALQIVLSRLAEAEHSQEGWAELKRMVRDQGHQLTEAARTEEQLLAEVGELSRVKDMIPAIIVAVGTLCAQALTRPDDAEVTEDYDIDLPESATVIKFRLGSCFVSYNPVTGDLALELDDLEPGEGDLKVTLSARGQFSKGQRGAVKAFFAGLRADMLGDILICNDLECERCRRLQQELRDLGRPGNTMADVLHTLREFARDGVHPVGSDSGWMTFSPRR